MGSDWLLASHSACHVDTQNLTTTHFSPSPLNSLVHSLSWLYKAFPFNKQKTQSILMKTFVVFTSCKVTPSSVEGCLNTPRVIDLAAKLGFLVFLFCRDFFSTKTNCCFSRKEETNLENQKWNGQWPPTPKTNSSSLLWVFKNEVRFLLHKSPNQNAKNQRKLYFWGATRVIQFWIGQSPR